MGKNIRVLMVDDEEQFRSTTSKTLTRRGFDTTVAESGEAAVKILKESEQDVVVLDVKMPGMDGHEALREIRKIDPHVKVIMLTGHGTMASAKESLEDEAFDYLSNLLNWRKNKEVIHSGKLKHFIPENGVYVYFRYNDDESVMVILNNSDKEQAFKTERFRGIPCKSYLIIKFGNGLCSICKIRIMKSSLK